MKNKIEDLRDHLFATLEALQDDEDPMDLDRAKVISRVAQTIIDSAKAETDHLRVVGGVSGTGFIPEEPREPGLPKSNGADRRRLT